MDYTKWTNAAISKINSIPLGTVFLLKDLFEGVEWSNLEKGERLSFGKFFKNEVLEGRIPNVSYIGKAQNNSAKYQKVG